MELEKSETNNNNNNNNQVEERWDDEADVVAKRMKEYEESAGVQKIDQRKPLMIRLDGHRFSQFTKSFKKPYDIRIMEAMKRTTADLMNEFPATAGYTQSDEITLIFIPKKEEEKKTENNNNEEEEDSKKNKKKRANVAKNPDEFNAIGYSGRIQKIVSLSAGFCAVRFAFHLRRLMKEDLTQQLDEKISKAYFDSRIFNVEKEIELLENLCWRIRDVKRNSKNNLGHMHFSQKALDSLTPAQVVKKLKVEKQIHWEDMPSEYRMGLFVKKQAYEKEAENPKTGQKVVALRHRLVSASLDLREAKEEYLPLVCEKLINDCKPFASSDWKIIEN